MTKKDTNDLESSLLVIKLDDTPWKAMKSPSQKRRIPSSAASGTTSKQRRICDQESYQSPLLHLAKTSGRRTRFTSIDDSVIVLEELTSSPASGKPTSSISQKKLPICTDDSIIILSDNEGESKAETDLGVILEDDSSGKYSELMEVTPARKVTKKKPVRHRFPFPLCRKADVETRTTAHKGQLPKKKRSKSKRWSQKHMVQSQSISIDSGDENTSRFEIPGFIPILYGSQVRTEHKVCQILTVPNDVSSRPHPQAEIITVDNSPAIETNKDIHHFATTESVVDVNKKKDEISVSTAEPSTSQPAATSDNVSRDQQPAIAKGISVACSKKKKVRKTRFSPYCVDTNGTYGSGGSNYNTILPIDSQYARSTNAMLQLAVRELQNPNWAAAANGIRSYYTEEFIVKPPGSLREIVIDGCNIAMAYTNGNSFSEIGLKLVIDYFMLRGHTVKVFVPQHVRSWQHRLLEKLHTEGIVVFTPSRSAGNKKIVSYDDRYILDYALLCDGIVVTRDQYRDLYEEKREWREVIEKRLLVPTFVGKCLMFPEDPLGRDGPRLEVFLRH